MKICGRKNWDKLPQIFEMLDRAAKEGILVSFDQYPYVAGSTMLGAILPLGPMTGARRGSWKGFKTKPCAGI